MVTLVGITFVVGVGVKIDTKEFARMLGFQIRQARKARGMSATKLAEILGLHRLTVSKIEKGESKIFLDTYMGLIDLFPELLTSILKPNR